ncbi:MAG: ClbS/DfsB family four-helix bundle protein [Anaerolineales bacterium]
MPAEMTKAALLELIRAEHANLADLLNSLDEARAILPGVEDHWSAKDIVAHLVFWEQLVANELGQVIMGKTPATVPPEAIEPLNERNFQENQHRPLAEIKADLERSMRTMLENVTTLSEAQLASECSWADEGSIAEHVANEMGHWQDHMAQIRRWQTSLST